jgi:hypothetical protein
VRALRVPHERSAGAQVSWPRECLTAAEAHRAALAEAMRSTQGGNVLDRVLREAYGDTAERVLEEGERASLRGALREVRRG